MFLPRVEAVLKHNCFFLYCLFSTILQMTLSWKRYRNFWEIAKSEYSSEKGHFKRSGNCITYSLHKLFCRRSSPYFRNLLYLFFFLFRKSSRPLISIFTTLDNKSCSSASTTNLMQSQHNSSSNAKLLTAIDDDSLR